MEKNVFIAIGVIASLLVGTLLGVIVAEVFEGEDEENGSNAIQWDEETYAPMIDPANFVNVIDNPYMPLIPGTKTIFEADTEDGKERIEVTVLNDTRVVMGVQCVVVRDIVYVDDVMIEDTHDWYAQDIHGNVWYMGEEVDNYKDGVLKDHHGAWEGGVNGAMPGLMMMAYPIASCGYRQEYLVGEAEDMGMVVSLTESASVEYGGFSDLVMIREWSPLDPEVVAHKYYARDIGVILEIEDTDRVELQKIITI